MASEVQKQRTQKSLLVGWTIWFIGLILMVVCGQTLDRQIGMSINHVWVVPGFAIGIFLLSKAWSIQLHARIERLEQQVRHLQSK
jgi:hypothetical protein